MDNKISIQKKIEQMFPECTHEMLKNQEIAYDLFCKKQADYGSNNITLGLNIRTKDSSLKSTRTHQNQITAQFGVVVRMNDKVQRLLNLYQKLMFSENEGILNEIQEVLTESIEDTCYDLMNYPNMLITLKKNKWGK